MLTNLILWVRTLFMATPAQWASQKLSDKEISEAIITMIFDPRNDYNFY